jgi:hypothetical protein
MRAAGKSEEEFLRARLREQTEADRIPWALGYLIATCRETNQDHTELAMVASVIDQETSS